MLELKPEGCRIAAQLALGLTVEDGLTEQALGVMKQMSRAVIGLADEVERLRALESRVVDLIAEKKASFWEHTNKMDAAIANPDFGSVTVFEQAHIAVTRRGEYEELERVLNG